MSDFAERPDGSDPAETNLSMNFETTSLDEILNQFYLFLIYCGFSYVEGVKVVENAPNFAPNPLDVDDTITTPWGILPQGFEPVFTQSFDHGQ
jgi:hypothetical protein